MSAVITTYQGDQFDWTSRLPTGDWSGLEVKCDMVHRQSQQRHEFNPIVSIGSVTTIQLLAEDDVTEGWALGEWDADIRIRRPSVTYGPFTSGKFVIQVLKPITRKFQ